MVISTILLFIAILLAVVLVHEFGHFFAAKKAGCRIEEFGFGFPPKLFSFNKWDTKWSFNLLPLGGFVKIEGENMEESLPGPYSFASKSATWRIIILAAGVTMNMVLAAVLLAVQAGIGAPVAVTDENAGTLTNQKTYILEVAPNTPAAQAGIQAFDRVAKIGSIENPSITQIQETIDSLKGSQVPLLIERQGRYLPLEALSRENPPEGEGSLGISLAATGLEKVPWWQAPWEGIKRTGQMVVAIVTQFYLLIEKVLKGAPAGEAFAGPVGIAVYTNEAAKQGLSYVLEFTALISINLAIINILPFPALDGGRILFVVIEKILGRRVPGKVESIIHTTGFALLILLMIFITFKDVQKYV